jgi:hypothetical protein
MTQPLSDQAQRARTSCALMPPGNEDLGSATGPLAFATPARGRKPTPVAATQVSEGVPR